MLGLYVKGILKLGMEFDRALPLQAEVTLSLDLPDSSLEAAAKALTDAHRIFIHHGCYFSKYSLYAENGGRLVTVNDVSPEDIEGGRLLEMLGEAQDNNHAAGISVFIKGDEK